MNTYAVILKRTWKRPSGDIVLFYFSKNNTQVKVVMQSIKFRFSYWPPYELPIQSTNESQKKNEVFRIITESDHLRASEKRAMTIS